MGLRGSEQNLFSKRGNYTIYRIFFLRVIDVGSGVGMEGRYIEGWEAKYEAQDNWPAARVDGVKVCSPTLGIGYH